MHKILSIILLSFISSFTFAQIPKMVLVKGGNFTMGTQLQEFPDESPERNIKINSFYIAEAEVQFEDYVKFCKFAGFNTPPGKAEYPLHSISWEFAVMYCNWLSTISGLDECYEIERTREKFSVKWNKEANGYRLPSEAEWEFAAKGGTLSKKFFYSGSNSPFNIGWFGENSKSMLHKSNKLQPNEVGAYDMTGNLAEWVWDYYDKSYPKAETDNPAGPKFGTSRVYRGGHYRDKLIHIENSRRSFLEQDGKSRDF